MWRALLHARALNQIAYESSYKHRTRIHKEHGELRETLEHLQGFTYGTGGSSWTESADRASYAIAKALMSNEVDLEERYQESLALGLALNARSGKAVPLRIREIIGTLEGVTSALRSLRRLALGLNVTDMDTAMGCISMLRVRWGRLLAFVDEESDWIHAMVAEARQKVTEAVQQGKLSSRFETLMNRTASSFGIEVEVPDENRPPKKVRFDESEGVRMEWNSDDDL
jgi:hypothetical protein